MHYESLIDFTNIATVARYLRQPQALIQTVVHVRERALLALLAEELAANLDHPVLPSLRLAGVIRRHAAAGAVRLSGQPLPAVRTELVDLASLPPATNCAVIYLPPFYLVHTPGLFEGTLLRPVPVNQTQSPPKRATRPSIKL